MLDTNFYRTSNKSFFSLTWLPQQIALCRDFVAFGVHVNGIARYFGCDPRRVDRLAYRIGWKVARQRRSWNPAARERFQRGLEIIAMQGASLPSPRPHRKTFEPVSRSKISNIISNDESADEMVELAKHGFSRAEIASVLNEKHGTKFTRNSVCGKLHRLGWVEGQQLTQSQLDEKKRQVAERARQKRRLARPKAKRARTNREVVLMDAMLCEPIVENPKLQWSNDITSLEHIKRGQCRFVIGEPKAGMFCGAKSIVGHSWCPRHARAVYRVS
jgi:hypothetical protein